MPFKQFNNKIVYRFFDKTFQTSDHYYAHKDLAFPSCSAITVIENCAKVTRAMEGKGLAVLRQVHGKKVHLATGSTEYGLEPEADAMVTNVPGLILGIYTADCAPVLLACKSGKVIGAAHCGWPSAKQNIIDDVLKLMHELGANEIIAMIGPSIKQDSYEISQDYHDDFIAEDINNADFFRQGREGHYFFDLPAYVKRKLSLAGVVEVGIHPDDTYTIEEKYYSWRRCFHKGIKYEGSLLAAIMIKHS